MRNLVSVCIPAYRQPAILLRAVRSVLGQEHCEFEIVITDDSPDDEVLSALGELLTHPKVKYFKNPQRLGAVANWNESLRRATGDVIKVLHHDDWLDSPNALAELVEPILSGRAAVTFSACRAMRVDESELFEHRAPEADLADLVRSTDGLAFSNFLGPPSVLAFDRALGIKFDTRYTWLSDVEFYIRAIRAAHYRYEYVNKLLVNTTAESPMQLSRDCEKDRIRTLIEYVTLFSECLDGQKKRRLLFIRFSVMLADLSFADRIALCFRAIGVSTWSVFVCLVAAVFTPRRVAAVI
jgi:glycosyltransferase involved in cell wall biosynthesis